MEFLAQLHPKIIHFPIAFFILYFLFESFGIILRKEFLQKSAIIILILAILFSVMAVLTGNQAYEIVKQQQTDTVLYKDFILKHELYATITLWYFIAILFFRIYFLIKKNFEGKIKFLFIILGFVGSVLIYLTGAYGGELVFKYGIGTKLF